MSKLPLLQGTHTSPRTSYKKKVYATCTSLFEKRRGASLTVKEQVRIERTLHLLKRAAPLAGKRVADLGCGEGLITKELVAQGAEVTAVDVLENPFIEKTIPFKQECLPYLSLEDSFFDGVVLTDVVAEIEPHLYRLTLSECARLLKKEGWLLCSTELDFYSYDALQCWKELVKSEFEMIEASKSYHRLHFIIRRFFTAPYRFTLAASDNGYRVSELAKRKGLFKLWFTLNSLPIIGRGWHYSLFCFHPLKRFCEQNAFFLQLCEKISKILWRAGGLSHIIVLARKKKI